MDERIRIRNKRALNLANTLFQGEGFTIDEENLFSVRILLSNNNTIIHPNSFHNFNEMVKSELGAERSEIYSDNGKWILAVFWE
jgi:hypothetical protein